MLTIGLIINPWAGIGGSVGLKGSDNAAKERALALGATPKSQDRTHTALSELLPFKSRCRFVTCHGDMGEDCLASLGFEYQCLELEQNSPTTFEDTRRAALAMKRAGVDVLVFAGGDGTARDICASLGDAQSIDEPMLPVLGVPAGVKIHSGVYGITPKATGLVLKAMIQGQLVDLKEAEVRDLDEDAFRQNHVRARHFGDMTVPQLGHFVQAVKQGGVEDENLVIDDIAQDVIERMNDDTVYLVGSGKTCARIMEHLNLPNTLLGIDAVLNGALLAHDLNADGLEALLDTHPNVRAIISVMGGQGHVFGRGNQQFSPRVLERMGKAAFDVVSSKTKITALEGRPLIIDSGVPDLDAKWAGSIHITTGYHDQILYPMV